MLAIFQHFFSVSDTTEEQKHDSLLKYERT